MPDGDPEAGGNKTAAARAGSATAALPSPAPPFAQLKGRAVLKDFHDPETRALRPFAGKVAAYDPKNKWYRVQYEDGDSEEADWSELQPLLQRAAAPGRAQGRGKPAAASSRAEQLPSQKNKQRVPQPAAQRQQQQVRAGRKPRQPAANAPPPPPQNPAAGMQQKPAAAKKPPAEPRKKRAKEGGGVATAAGKKPAAGKPAGKAPPTKLEAAAGDGAKAAGAKRRGSAGEAGASGSGADRKRRKHEGRAIELALPEAEQEYVYERGQEPWRLLPGFKWPVHDEVDPAGAPRIKAVQRQFYKYYIQAEVDERQRTDRIITQQKAAAKRKKVKVKRPANRPDRTTESRMIEEKLAIRDDKVAGHCPGWDIGSRAYGRSELSILGLHRTPIAGIDFVKAGRAGKGAPPFAVSVMVSGWYQDNSDSGAELWYTGEGGNDLLHGRNQVKDQQLGRGNKALMGNIQLGIPIRVTRKQRDKHGHYGCAYIYDGLYDVLAYRHTQGKEGTWVYQFRLRRRQGQGPLLTESTKWGGISAARAVVPRTRQGVVDLDISRGQEARPIAAVDDTWLASGTDGAPHGDLPPCTGLEHVVDEAELVGKVVRGVNQERIAELRQQGYRANVQYITQYEFLGKAAVAAAQLRPAVLPPELRSDPHAHVRRLNHGVPYNDGGQLFHIRPVVYECCAAWTGCSDGQDCRLAVTQRPSRYRLEIFRTANGCGWGIRSLDTIPQYAYVCTYLGQVYDAEEHAQLLRTVEEQDAEYAFDMVPRPDTRWDGSEKPTPDDTRARFVACGQRKRNVGAFLNHSCNPNCFVQPVLDTHHDTTCPKICIFAADNIPPLVELTFDYGAEYAASFPGGCRCGAVDCISKRGPAPRPAAERVASLQPEAVEPSSNAAGGEPGLTA